MTRTFAGLGKLVVSFSTSSDVTQGSSGTMSLLLAMAAQTER
jgi:hypothetical protein